MLTRSVETLHCPGSLRLIPNVTGEYSFKHPSPAELFILTPGTLVNASCVNPLESAEGLNEISGAEASLGAIFTHTS